MHLPIAFSSIAFSSIAWAVLLLFGGSHGASPDCRNPRLRKEIRDLTVDEWNAFTTAINTLKRNGRYDVYIQVHDQYTSVAHNGDNFFAWHRRMIYDFETDVLQLTGSRLSGLPYFDPHSSYDMFNSTVPYFIGNPVGCITAGPFAGFLRLNGACVPRTYDGSITAVDPRIIAALILTNADYHTFSETYELGQHSEVHTAVGGTMGMLSESPSDPIFYLHHSHVDYIWYKRQWYDPEKLYWDMAGTHNGQPVSLTSLIPGPWGDIWGYGTQISDTYWVMCYDYLDPSPRPGAPRLLKRQALSPSDNNHTVAQRSAPEERALGGVFQPVNEHHIPEVKPLTTEQLRNFNIDPAKHLQIVKQLNAIGKELNMKLEQGERVLSIRDIKKSDTIPDPSRRPNGSIGAVVQTIDVLSACFWSCFHLLVLSCTM